MTTPYTQPAYHGSAYNCPLCGAYADQDWYTAGKYAQHQGGYKGIIKQLEFAECRHCGNHSIWLKQKMIYPFSGTAPLPNPDMPADILADFDEARAIASLSPRGAAALLRLTIQKLMVHLGEKGKDLNKDIGNLVKKGLPEKMQRALDSVRVIGNNAVHPGQIDLKDDIDTAQKLFVFVNIICDMMITQPKQIDEFYDANIPDNQKEQIKKRDGQ